MTSRIEAYLTFSGECRAAMEFYQSCLGGDLHLQTVEGSPAESQVPASMKHQIMHGILKKGDIVVMASDMSREKLQPGNNVSLCIACATEAEINEYFNKLSEGGKITDPLAVQFWGDLFGAFIDKFGIQWMMNFSKTPH